MSNIITPKTRLAGGREKLVTKDFKKKSSQPEKIIRTGKNTFTVKHDNGYSYDCQIDPSKVKFKKDVLKDAGGSSKFFVPGDIKPKNLMSNADRRRMGLEPDPELPE